MFRESTVSSAKPWSWPWWDRAMHTHYRTFIPGLSLGFLWALRTESRSCCSNASTLDSSASSKAGTLTISFIRGILSENISNDAKFAHDHETLQTCVTCICAYVPMRHMVQVVLLKAMATQCFVGVNNGCTLMV